MNRDDIIRLYDDDYAASYEEAFLLSDLTRSDSQYEIELLRGMLRPGTRWLDVACGTGYFLSQFPGIERAGIDLSPAMLQRARGSNPGVFFAEHDYREPRPDWTDQWDLVSCMWYAYSLVDTVADMTRLIENLASWTAPGGTCFVPLADPRLITGVNLPYQAPSPNAGKVMVTGILWSYVENDGRKVHSNLIAPNIEFMVELFEKHFESVSIVHYPPAFEGWQGRPALLATRKRKEGAAQDQSRLEGRAPLPDHRLDQHVTFPAAKTKDTSTTRAALTRLLSFARVGNWWHSKIPPLLAVAYVAILLEGLDAHIAIPRLACYLLSVCCVAIYGHIVNDIFDVQSDLKSGKPNAMAQIGWAGRALLCITFLGAGFAPALLVDYSGGALLLLAMNYLWPTLYSLPVVRLKERGLLGVVCDLLGSHVTPTLLALSIFNALDNGAPAGHFGFPILAVLWAAALGLKGILHHQVLDRENDLRGGTRTFATVTGSSGIMRFLTAFNLGVELPISCALVAAIYRSCPLAAAALAIYCALEATRFALGDRFALTSEAATSRRVVPFTNEMFYILWFPISAALQLAVNAAAWWWLPVLHVVMFYRTIVMQRVELAPVVERVCAKPVQPAAIPWTIEAARPLGDRAQDKNVRTPTNWTILLFATSAMGEFVNNALAGIRRCGIDADRVQVVFPANSERVLAPIVEAFGAKARVLEQMVDVSPDDIPNGYVDWDTAEFNVLLTYRFRVLRILLSEGRNVVSADVDVAWLRDPLPYLSDVLERYPWACQIEPYAQFPSHFCLGFFALKATPETTELIDLHIARNVGDALKHADQTLFREILLETPRYFASVFALPESLFPTGRLYQTLQFRGVPPPVPMLDTQSPFIFHANWCVGLDNKQRLLSHAGAWFGPATEAIREGRQEIFDLHLNKPGLHTFSVPAGVNVLRLLSEGAFAPHDDRRLGAAITMIGIDGVKLPLDDPSLNAGFHLLEREHKRRLRWTDGTAIVSIPVSAKSRKVEIDVLAVAAIGATQPRDQRPEPPQSQFGSGT